MWFAAMSFCASALAQPSEKPVETPSAQEVLSALSRRSQLPEEELRRLTADCAADQQSMYFCAYRDVVAAELKLDRVMADKARERPGCKGAIDAKVERWKVARDRTCAKSAAREWGGGSMEPTARNICLAESTGRMVRQVQRLNSCPRP
ncbi:lysozyme inhibitor LprI family protein [Variovorax sp. GB1P17]|uniref:lysozyme inhibitor LprI family protein n=1 Tax=Variovorax sp. GB1P17 TaxID=3443740 RepID=UPI003F4725D4